MMHFLLGSLAFAFGYFFGKFVIGTLFKRGRK